MKYASQDYMDNMFGRYNPARMMVKKKNRKAQEELEEKMEKESECGCKEKE